MSDLTFNLADRANHSLPYTVSTTVSSTSDLKEKLAVITEGAIITTTPSPKPIILVFGGQESESIGMSEHVYQSSKLLQYHLDTCNEILTSFGFESLYPVIFQQAPISNLVALHSALFAIQYSSAKAWIDSGLKVSAVVGHSFGQLTALCISGVLSLADALKLVCGRATIMAKHWGVESGAMLSLQTDRQTVSKVLNSVQRRLEIACFNGPKSHVVVGSVEEVDALEDFLAKNPSFGNSIRRKRLRVTHGFHSMLTEPLLPHLTALSKELKWREPRLHLELCTESAETPDFRLLASHTRRPVFFQQAIERLDQEFPQSTYLEAGRGSSIIQLVKGSVAENRDHLFLSPQLTTSNALGSLVDITIDLWKAGYAVQYWPFHRYQKPHYQFLRIPSYQFEKTRHWVGFTNTRTEKEAVPEPVEAAPTHELLNFLRFNDKEKSEAVFSISPQSDRFQSMLKGHVMAGQSLAPASLYFEIAARAAMFLQSDTSATTFVPTVQDLTMKSPIGLDTTKNIVLTLKRMDDSLPSWSFSVTTELPPNPAGAVSAPFEQSTGRVCLQRRDDSRAAQAFKRFETLTGTRRCNEIMNHPEAEGMEGKHIYRAFNHIVHYAENFQGIKKVACLRMEASGKVKMEVDPSDPDDQRLCHTPMTDSFMQFAGFLVNYFNNDSLEDVFVCSKIAHIEIGGSFNPDAKEWLVYSNMTEGGESDASADAYVFEAGSKKMVMAAFGFRFSKMPQSLLLRMLKSVNKSATSEKSKTHVIHPKSDTDLIKEVDVHTPLAQADKDSQAAKNGSSKRAELCQILHNVTDVPLENLKDESTLEDLGIDSLMATEILNDIRVELGLTVDLTSFLCCPDIKTVLAYVDSMLCDDGSEVHESSENTIFTPSLETPTPDTIPEDSVPADDKDVSSGEPQSRPSITSAYDSFMAIQFGYDELAKGTKASNFWAEAYPEQKRLVLAYVVEAFTKLGCDLTRLRPGDVVPEVHGLARHKQLIRQYFHVLEDGDLILATKESFIRTDVSLDPTSPEDIYQAIHNLWPQHANVTQLVKIIGSELAECLTGQKDGLQLIFGNRGNKHLLEDMYENWPLLRTPTILLGDFLKNAFTNSTGSGKFRILEIGAGTGGTTKYLVKYLKNHGIPFDYTFTDISSSLVHAAKKNFKDIEEMSFEVLDIEKAPMKEYENAFHVIIATNCIHATRNLKQSLVTLNKMTRQDGAIALVEITQVSSN